MSYGAPMKNRVLVIVGPTASGKSALAVELARKFDGEIISADSRQVYRGLDIGTGKITKREMRGVPHYLLDVASPRKTFTAHDFVSAAQKKISTIIYDSKLPIVVGGTGFYIDALVGRITLPDVPPDKKLRASLQKKSAAQLFVLLKKRDPKRAAMLSTPSERNNKVRLIRAIEVAKSVSKNPMRELRSPSFDVLWVGIEPHSAKLRKNIHARLSARIRGGMVVEAKRLHARGLTYKRMREFGLEYRSLARYLQGETSLIEMENELQSDIWRYARKQIGYWKRNKEIRWFKPSEKQKMVAAVRRWMY